MRLWVSEMVERWQLGGFRGVGSSVVGVILGGLKGGEHPCPVLLLCNIFFLSLELDGGS